jgi:SAM-dependent methyltransferase
VFGGIAAAYDATRPTYPVALLDDLLLDDPDPVLDVGCGTGIVAALLAQRGARVVGVEPDARMAQIAQAKGIEVEVSSFERWDSRDRRFALLTCGQAWHWVEPDAGADKAAEVLMPGGRLALFWNFATLPDPVIERLDAAYAGFSDLGLDRTANMRSNRAERAETTTALLAVHPAFTDAATRGYPWSRTYTTDEWVGQLATHSDHAILPAERRNKLLEAVRAAIDQVGGSFEADYSVLLISARRV